MREQVTPAVFGFDLSAALVFLQVSHLLFLNALPVFDVHDD
jgi:hypothetical protein